MTTPNDLVPPRPDLVPPPGTTSPMRPRPSSPTPLGDEVALSRPRHPTKTASDLVPRDEVTDDVTRSHEMTTWTPDHESTRDAWQAVLTNLQARAARGLWSSRTIAESIATQHGLTHARAADLIRSAINHGYLEERPYPGNPRGHHRTQTQIRPAAR